MTVVWHLGRARAAIDRAAVDLEEATGRNEFKGSRGYAARRRFLRSLVPAAVAPARRRV